MVHLIMFFLLSIFMKFIVEKERLKKIIFPFLNLNRIFNIPDKARFIE